MKIKYKIKENITPGPGDWVEVISLDKCFQHFSKEVVGYIFKLPERSRLPNEFWEGKDWTSEPNSNGQKYPVNYYLYNLRKLTKEEIKKFKTEGKL